MNKQPPTHKKTLLNKHYTSIVAKVRILTRNKEFCYVFVYKKKIKQNAADDILNIHLVKT